MRHSKVSSRFYCVSRSSFSESRTEAERGGGTVAQSSSSLHVALPVDAIKRGGSSLYSPNLPLRAHRSLLAIYGVTMMQKPHPEADVPAYKQSPWKTRAASGCSSRHGQHCLPPHLPLSLPPDKVISCHRELCAYWTCKCF